MSCTNYRETALKSFEARQRTLKISPTKWPPCFLP